MTKNFEFVISRTFDAPVNIVWKAWTDKEQMSKWFGPKGCTITSSDLNLKVGGVYHYGMQFNGIEMWGKWTFKEITSEKQLVFIVSFTDSEGKNIKTHPMNPNWPREILSTINFIKHGNKTEVEIKWHAYNASANEIKTFEEGKDSMKQGWGGTLDQLQEYLSN